MKLHSTYLAALLATSWLVNPLFAADPIQVSSMESKLISQQTSNQGKIALQREQETKKGADTNSATKSGQKDPQGSELNRSTDSGKPATSKGKVTKYPEDRPWIIKRKTLKETKARKIKPPAFTWKDQEQKKKCDTYLGRVKEQFLHARYYSIQGDPCTSADHARKFMDLVEKCEQECPEDFLQKIGYTQQIVRNLRLLNELGTKKCLGRLELDQEKPAKTSAPAKVGPSKAASRKN
jgi:hypothetical protein